MFCLFLPRRLAAFPKARTCRPLNMFTAQGNGHRCGILVSQCPCEPRFSVVSKAAVKLVAVASFNVFTYSFKKKLLSAFCEAGAITNNREADLPFEGLIPSPSLTLYVGWPTVF